MADFKEQNNLWGGMNSDDMARRAPKGDYREGRNFRKYGGVIRNLKGTIELNNNFLSTGDYYTICAFDNYENGQVYEFIFDGSESKDHRIMRFNKQTKQRFVVTKGSWLNFVNKPLYGVDMVGNHLLFTDGLNQPRAIDVVSLEANQVPLSEFNLAFVRYAPTRPLKVTKSLSVGENRLLGKQYQFTHRYIYKDGSKSTFGPYTPFINLADPLFGLTTGLVLEVISDIFGATSAQVQLKISEVEIAVRNSSTGNFRSIVKIPITQATYEYTNQSELGPVPVSDIAKAYDSVPRFSKDLEVSGGKVFFANNTEDFPEVPGFDIENPAIYLHHGGESNNPRDMTIPGPYWASGNSLKTNSRYQLAVQFYDEAGRFPLAYTNSKLLFDTNFQSFNGGLVSLGFKFPASFVPPIWAKSYSILRSNSLDTSYFIQGVANNVKYIRASGYTTEGVQTFEDCTSAEASFLCINIANFYSATKKSATEGNPSAGLFYTFQEGDRVRVSGKTVDSRILTFSENNLIVSADDTGARTITAGDSPVIEIYRETNLNEEGVIFYETGEHYPILNAGTPTRAWSKSDWTWTDETEVDTTWFNKYPFLEGDVHYHLKNFWYDVKPDTTYYRQIFVQSMSPFPGKEHLNWDHATGRPTAAAITKQTEKSLQTQIRFGGMIIPESRVNNLFSFNEFDQHIYPLNFGPIAKIGNVFDYAGAESGDVMIALFKNTAISIYIGKSTIQTTNGEQQVALSDRVLGSYNVLDGGYGCEHPESFTSYKGKAWYWCREVGGWIRYAQNGLKNLSEIKMATRHKNIQDGYARSMYDPFYKELYCKFEETVFIFSEETGRWESERDYQDCQALIPGFAFKGARVSILEQNALHNTFFGIKYNAEITGLFSEPGTEAKVLQTIQVDSTHAWYPVTVLTEDVSLSTIGNLSRMQKREWIWQTDIGVKPGTDKKMRSRSFIIKLRLDPAITTESVLYDLFLNNSHSQPQTAK